MVVQDKPTTSKEKEAVNSSDEAPEEEASASSSVSASVETQVQKETPSSESESEVIQPAPSLTSSASPKEEEEEEGIPLEKKNSKLFIIGIIVFILVVGATIAILYFRAKRSVEKAQEVTEAEEVEPLPSPSPTALPRDEISLEILNGTDIEGLASETATTFEDLGYEIVKIGNADDTEGNQLYVDPDLEDLLGNLLEDVEEELEIASISGELTDSTASARIILGEE